MPEDESPAEAPPGEEPQESATEVKQERLEAEKGFRGEANERELQELVANLSTNILIIGAGGAGNNTLERLYREGIDGVEMLALNTDAQHLLAARVPHRMLIGKQLTKGLGAGAEPHLGEGAAEEARDDLLNACHEADIVFLTGGLGGGTGTGALPVIARFAKEKQALTIAIVTLPFSNEGARRKTGLETGAFGFTEKSELRSEHANQPECELGETQLRDHPFLFVKYVIQKTDYDIQCWRRIRLKTYAQKRV